jgi:TPR repeat protein
MGSHGFSQNTKPLPTAPAPESPRLRQAPRSPVKVNFQPEDWAQPSNANIETHVSYAKALPPVDRELPKTPEAPTPPPHTPLLEQTGDTASQAQPNTLRIVPDTTASYVPYKPLPSVGLGLEQTPHTSGIASPEPDDLSFSDKSQTQGMNRLSRESDATTSTSQKPTSTESSARTSASSVSGVNETSDCQEADVSPESSVIEEQNPMVPQLQYHHEAFLPRASTAPIEPDPRTQSTPELAENAASINRHLTPNFQRRSSRNSLQRPLSAYSVYSDFGPRGRSPGFGHARTPSSQARRSPDHRPSSYAELLNVPYPQPAPAPITFDNSMLRNAVGSNASLLSSLKTLEMYRQNVKKTNDFSIQYSFAVFLISTAQEMGLDFNEPAKPARTAKSDRDSPYSEPASSSPQELVREARTILQKLSNNGYPFAQYYLADGYASGLFSKGKEDYNSAFPLFVLAAKHGHAESAYRTALCYEFGWGCRKDAAKAVQFLRTAASKRHPGAMTRLGKACLSGDLGEKRYREGIKWLKLATESADTIYNAAPYHLGCLYETGYGDDIFQDESYTAELFTQAADLGHPEANYRMGDAYEHGKLNCPRDPALSVHFYTGAAERGHAAAMMGLCAWYMVGAEPILEKDEEEAYEWARRSAELGKFNSLLCVSRRGQIANSLCRLRQGTVRRGLLYGNGHRLPPRHP